MPKLLGVCGSPRHAATEYVLKKALEEASSVQGIEIDTIFLRGKKLNFCIHCNKCIKEDKTFCMLYEDDMTAFYERFYAADAYLIASPVYEMNITAQLAAFFNRFRPTYNLMKRDPTYFSNKFGSAIAVGGTRNGGQEMTINAIHGFYHTHGIAVVNGGLGCYGGAAVWSQDRMAQGAQEDETGIKNTLLIARKLAQVTASHVQIKW
jgi:multimeric flavodoxin WrbA